MKSEDKMLQLIQKLKTRNNNTYLFFEQLLSDFRDGQESLEAKKKLRSSFSMTQYADFTSEEEKLLGEIIEDTLNEE